MRGQFGATVAIDHVGVSLRTFRLGGSLLSGPHSTVIPDTTFVTIPAAAGLDADSALPWLIDVDVFEQAVANTNWDTITISAAVLLNGRKDSIGFQNASISFDVVLAKGTWTIEVLHDKNTDSGIISVQLGGVEKGTIDTYSGGSINILSSVTGIAITATAKYRLALVMATKNASSSNYYGRIQHVQLRRTA